MKVMKRIKNIISKIYNNTNMTPTGMIPLTNIYK